MMSFTEQLLERICIAVNGTSESTVDGKTISFKAPYRRLPILDAIKEKTAATSRCIPFEQEEIDSICVCCGKPAKHMVYWGRAY